MIEALNTQKQKTPISFKARKIAVARPIVDGVVKEIEIYRLSKKEQNIVKEISDSVNLSKLFPSKIKAPNFSIWQQLIDSTGEYIGFLSRPKVFLAVQDNKPCGMLLATHNMKKGQVITFATWPTAVEQKVKKAGSSLFTAFLNLAKRKKLEKISLEPVIKGPTDSVGFYKAHGMDFPDKYASVMTAPRVRIASVADTKNEELNFENLKHPIKVNLMHKLGFDANLSEKNS